MRATELRRSQTRAESLPWELLRGKQLRGTGRLRIAHVTPQLNVGGLERLLVEFAKRTDRAQFDLRFVSLGARGTLANEIENEGWLVTALELPPGLHPTAVWRLMRYFQTNRVDVVHTHNNKALIYAAPAAKLAGVRRIVHTRHGQNYNCSRKELAAFRYACRLATIVVGVSEDCAEMCCQEGIAGEKVVTVCNAIDTARFRFAGPRSNGPLLMVGRLSSEKNVILLIRALSIALRDAPRLKLEIVGDGPCRTELQSLVRSLGIDDRVRFLGEIQDVENRMKNCSIFVLPSLTEGISLTLLEAMAVGIPAIATDVGGNSEVVVDQVTGRLVPSNNPVGLAEAILQIWSDPERARHMGYAGRERVTELFDIRRMVTAYEDLYLGVLPASRNREAAVVRHVDERILSQ